MNTVSNHGRGVLQRAVSLLRASQLGDRYADAGQEWADTGGDVWDVTVADGLDTHRP